MLGFVFSPCFLMQYLACAVPEGVTGGPDPPPPLNNHKNIGFLSNTGPDPLNNHKAAKPDSMFGRHRHSSETPILVVYSTHQLKKTLSKLEPL